MPITRYMKRSSSYDYWHSTITFLKPKKVGERLIVVDPGHGGADPGAVANGVRESDLNLDIAKRLKNLFAGSNIRIHLTRGDDSYVGLGERTASANAMNADLFLSIHNNAYYAASNGSETFHYPTPQWRNGISAAEFASVLQKHLLSELGLYNRGVKQNTFSVLKYANMPSALVEIAFLTNIYDVAKLKDPVFRQKSAVALYKALNEVIARMN
jgi:N-acetylmuramoyl-L-alanine amidase